MNSRNQHILNDPSGGGEGGCVIGSSTTGPSLHGYGSPPGGGGMVDMGGGVGPPCPVPTPPWVKPPSNSGMITPESDVSSCSSPAASGSYGAPSQQQQQQQHRTFYGSDVANNYCNNVSNNGNLISSSTNNNGSGMFYDSSGEIVDQSQYYHQHQHHPHSHQHHVQLPQSHQHFQQMHLQQKSGSSNNSPSLENSIMSGDECVVGSENRVVVSSGGGNFYGFYNASANHSGHYTTDYHHQHHHDNIDSSGYPSGGDMNSCDSRIHHHQQQHQYYHQNRQDDNSGGSNSSANVPVGQQQHSNYFNSPVGTPNPNYPTSSDNFTPPARYGSPMIFPNNHNSNSQQVHHHQQNLQSQQQMPIRRNSIESYSSEPGDYASRFACNSSNNGSTINVLNSNSTNGQQLHHHQNYPNNSAVGMNKRDCSGMNNRVSPSMNVPSTNQMNASDCWSPHPTPPGGGYYPSPSPNSGCSSSSSPNACTNSGSASIVSRTTSNYINHGPYNQNVCGIGGESNANNCGNNFYAPNHQQQQLQQQSTQFKSCVYEQSKQHHDIKEGIMGGNNSGNLKAASAIKHRSLSLSMPLPSYMEQHKIGNRSELNPANNFISQSHRQLPQHHHHHPQLPNNHGFNQMMSTSQQHHHHHHQCASTTGLIPPPEQNLLTPNSDDDMPFRAASASGQSDLDSSYETMGDEGCSSTSTNVASHCVNNTSGSSCSGVDTSNHCGPSVTIVNTTTTEHLHTMNTMSVDCHRPHHHHNPHPQLSFSSSSCMQTHNHHHINATASSIGVTMMEIPNSTVALCTTNVDDLEDSSSDSSSVELHNVITAVVEQSSIETPENTMMGDEVDDDVMGGPISSDDVMPSEGNRLDLHHHLHQNQDSLTNVNIISTTTNELEEDDPCHNDDNNDDNCSESSMSHINSSFTADMFCNNSSNSIMSSATDNATSNMNLNGVDKVDDEIINSSSSNCATTDFSSISQEGHFSNSRNNASVSNFDFRKATSTILGASNLTSHQLLLSNKSSSFSPPPQAVSSPQKITKRSFSETDKDSTTVMNTTTTSLSTTSATPSSVVETSTSLVSFGASFRKNVGESSSISAYQKEKDNSSNNFQEKASDLCENSASFNRINVSNDDNFGSSNNNSSNNNDDSNNSSSANNTSGDISGCKAIDIIISSTNSNGSLMSIDGNKKGHMVSIPKGWKREILKGSSNENGGSSTGSGINNAVVYISPSDTKIRNFNELKNYIGSDGTCKCGLDCPLRLEITFSFDPKVTNMTVEDEKENLESVNTTAISGGGGCTNGRRNGASSSTLLSSSNSSSSATTTTTSKSVDGIGNAAENSSSGGESDSRLLCNHKRKIPKAEDSPLISSTRDDLGDFGEKLKKRRLSGNECMGEKLVSCEPFRKDQITTSGATNNGGSNTNNSSNTNTTGATGSKNNASQNVPVPFCQQSPDTTTQTPQTEMSPASSVCSDSSTIQFSGVGGNNGVNRSLTSTPTPTLSSSSSTSSSSSSSVPVVVAAAAGAVPATKFGNSPSQGVCEFVWPSPPQQVAGSSLLSSSIQLPPQPQQLALSNQNQHNTLWINPSNSLATISPITPIVCNNSNSLTLNYVQPPSNSIGKVGPSIMGQGPVISGSFSAGIIPPTTASTKATSSPISTITSPTATSSKKTSFQQYPSKTVKRSSSPCPNVDVRQLSFEKNRPPPVPSTNSPSNKGSLSNIIASSALTPVVSSSPTITSLPNLPIVSNPNILFTVTPPLMAANKTELVSLSTPTLPILPLLPTGKLPTVGSIDTSCGAATIVTTLQPNTGIFSTDGNTLFHSTSVAAPLQNKENPIIQSTTQPKQLPTKPEVTVSNSGNATVAKKKVAESIGKNDKEGNSLNKPQGKDGKSKSSTSSSNNSGDKSPLQLAQDIVNRFEKKPGEKIGNKTNENKTNDGNASASSTAIGTSSKEVKIEVKDKLNKEKSLPKEAAKLTKVGNKAVEEKSNNNDAAAAATKIDSSLPLLSSTSHQQSNPDATGENKSVGNKEGIQPETSKGSGVLNDPENKSVQNSSSALDRIQKLDDSKGKIPVDPSLPSKQLQPAVAVANNHIPVSTVIGGTTQLPPQQQPVPLENTIITSQTSAVMNTAPLILKDGGLHLTTDQGLTLTTSVSAPIPTISLSAMGNQIIQTSGGAPVVSCSSAITAGGLSTFAHAGANQIILQQPHVNTSDSGNGANSTFLTTSSAAAAQGTAPLRYPILQTIQPLFLNSAGPAGGPLIISQPVPTSQDQSLHGNPTLTQQSFISYDQNGTPTATFDASGVGAFQSMLQPPTTTMVLDPSICAGNPNLTAGGKKKKKRLSKKQQQQQAQIQLQQQLILQQIQAQQQQAAAAAIAPLTIFPQSFNLGPQGFSLQPAMNFFPTPTILTLPNLILNPADGTLFIQPSATLPTTATTPIQSTTMKLGQFPLTTTTTISQNPQNIAPKKDGGQIIQNLITEPLKPASTPGLDPGSDDSRQNPTPDSSTNDLQLGLINVATGHTPQSNTITLNISAPTTTTVLHNPNPLMSKKNSKCRTVSSSSTTVKRILPQKQILPKIDSTTPSTTENAN